MRNGNEKIRTHAHTAVHYRNGHLQTSLKRVTNDWRNQRTSMPTGEYHFRVQKSPSTCKSVIGQQHSNTADVEPWWMAGPRHGVDRLGDDCLPVELL